MSDTEQATATEVCPGTGGPVEDWLPQYQNGTCPVCGKTIYGEDLDEWAIVAELHRVKVI